MTWKDIKGIDNEELYHRYMLLSLHGQSKDALAKTKLGTWEYDIAGLWYKCNMTDIHAAVGLAQIKRYDAILARRREKLTPRLPNCQSKRSGTIPTNTDHPAIYTS